MKSAPVIVTLDIETSPLTGYTWGIWEQNVIEVTKRSSILCAAWKYLGDKSVHAIAQYESKGYKPGVEDDYEVVKKLRDVLDEADIVVTQNGNAFDLPIIYARMFEHGLTPPSPFKKIDTKKLAKSIFKFESNKLEHMVQYAGIASKTNPGGFGAWKGCMAGNKKAWRDMVKYNKNDVVITELLYLKMRPFMESHPNLNVITNRLDACPKCQNTDLQSRGFSITATSRKRRYQCVGTKGCGGWSTGPAESIKGLVTR